MSYTPHDEEVLWDIVRAARQVQSYLQGVDRGDFDENAILRDAIIWRIATMGEAAKRLSTEFREKHADVPWKSIIGVRNEFIHGYDRIRIDELWSIATRDVPALLVHLEPLITEPDD